MQADNLKKGRKTTPARRIASSIAMRGPLAAFDAQT
jgi:hypothetical protein